MGEDALGQKLERLRPALNERSWRLTLAAEAIALGRGGVAKVQRATGASRPMIVRGIAELEAGETIEALRVRRRGGGRKSLVENDPTLLPDLAELVEPHARGDPMTKMRWTVNSLRTLADKLHEKGHQVSHVVVGELLKGMGFSLQSNQKTLEGASHPDRNAQFLYINDQAAAQQRKREPVISVDTKKKELVGRFKNAGKVWRPEGEPERVNVHDFPTDDGKAVPYGIYDLTKNKGWVSVGINHDTAEFAVHSIAQWWAKMGRRNYPEAKELYITADSGGSNGSRLRLWKWELQRFANRTGLILHVSHFPPGTSKWNKIEHRLFSFITQNWKGRPLTSIATIVSLIAATKTAAGLEVKCEVDERIYEKGRRITDEEMATIRLRPDAFHGDWNYAILPAPVRAS